MKKINKFDLFLCICVLLGSISGLTLLAMEQSLGEQILWLRILTLILFIIPVVILVIVFIWKIILQIKEYSKVKKGKNDEKK